MILSHACSHMTFENNSANAHAKLAPNNDCEDLSGICLCEDHFMSVPLVACNVSCSFFIIPSSYNTSVLSYFLLFSLCYSQLYHSLCLLSAVPSSILIQFLQVMGPYSLVKLSIQLLFPICLLVLLLLFCQYLLLVPPLSMPLTSSIIPTSLHGSFA